MIETYRIVQEGQEIGQITATGLVSAKRVREGAPMGSTDMVEDPRLLKSVSETGVTLFVLMLSKGCTAEKVAVMPRPKE